MLYEVITEGIGYLFKLRLTSGVKKLLERLMRDADWQEAGQGWQGAESALRLSGWSRHRRVVVLRRRLSKHVITSYSIHYTKLYEPYRPIQ